MNDQQVITPSRQDGLVRQVGRELVDQGLLRGRSLFTPDRSVWTLDVARELHRLYNERLDTSTDPFMVKLQRQLGGASDPAIQLTAELLTLQGLPLLNLTAGKLQERITIVLGWMRQPVTIPQSVLMAFTEGIWNGGIGAHTMIWKWLADAIDFVCAWWQLPQHQRDLAASDPWAWQNAVYQYKLMPSLREELLYLAFPTHFLPIVNVAHKKAIRDAFAEQAKTPLTGDINRDLFDITVSVQNQVGQPVDYYRQPFSAQWRKQADRPPGERRAWLVRPRQGGHDLVQRWVQESFVSLAASHLGEVSAGANRAEIRAAVEVGYQHLDYAQRVGLANEYHAFLSQMDSDDIVATIIDDQLYVGVIDGDPEYNLTDDGARLRRPAGWLSTPPASVESLPAPLPAELDQQGTVVDLTGAIDALSSLIDADTETPAPQEPRRQPVLRLKPNLPPATDELAARLHLNTPWLQDLVSLWHERSQIVLYGPPGTGKTFIARALAAHVAERDAVRLVQFHPSYAYEDFFEGFRPIEGADGGPLSFAKIPGPLREIAAEARNNPEQPYVLIVDEINRANLAKVFGELYFLLEYREATVRLQYSPSEAFNLPPNVFIIGTMNTADRSIALVDAAIRRRFAFVELHPDDQPVRDVLANWLTANDLAGDHRAALLAALNEAIGVEDHDFKIGPSYLMRPNLDTDAALQRVWRYDLMPLLEEHYYGRLNRSQIRNRFGLEAIRARITPPAADEAPQP